MLENRTVISFLYPKINKDILEVFSAQKSTAFSLNNLPTQYRGFSYDAVTSQVGKISISFNTKMYRQKFVDLKHLSNLSMNLLMERIYH